jgi:hypothetical protein
MRESELGEKVNADRTHKGSRSQITNPRSTC